MKEHTTRFNGIICLFALKMMPICHFTKFPFIFLDQATSSLSQFEVRRVQDLLHTIKSQQKAAEAIPLFIGSNYSLTIGIRRPSGANYGKALITHRKHTNKSFKHKENVQH